MACVCIILALSIFILICAAQTQVTHVNAENPPPTHTHTLLYIIKCMHAYKHTYVNTSLHTCDPTAEDRDRNAWTSTQWRLRNSPLISKPLAEVVRSHLMPARAIHLAMQHRTSKYALRISVIRNKCQTWIGHPAVRQWIQSRVDKKIRKSTRSSTVSTEWKAWFASTDLSNFFHRTDWRHDAAGMQLRTPSLGTIFTNRHRNIRAHIHTYALLTSRIDFCIFVFFQFVPFLWWAFCCFFWIGGLTASFSSELGSWHG